MKKDYFSKEAEYEEFFGKGTKKVTESVYQLVVALNLLDAELSTKVTNEEAAL